MTGVSLTVDLEDLAGVYAPDGRYAAMAQKLLDFCDAVQRRATFFTVGRVAETAPDLVKAIAARGHEIAYHTHNHVPLTQENPQRFRHESSIDKMRIEQLSGRPVTGFRAPCFSLTPKTLWALDVLAELGFRYSSSIMPTNISRFGFPNAPREPFQWPNGMIELPLPVANVGPLRVPYLGGVYLYALPFFMVRRWIKRAGPDKCLWTYTHPFDFDVEAPFERSPGTPAWISLIMWSLRHRAENKIRRVIGMPDAKTLEDRVAALSNLNVIPDNFLFGCDSRRKKIDPGSSECIR
ncbi:MAG: polysaccharide deacetylase family protein [Alphaproteobacteria bacterium]|nr:polysaccharide deacetylase family protein [Alphaproteobacteria bacterium]